MVPGWAIGLLPWIDAFDALGATALVAVLLGMLAALLVLTSNPGVLLLR
ncbi:MAG: hypothetical protein M3069_01315 [Chloroflexota bacterium]|nr:hypothetical protein [Chloroflexota bacterium]